MIAFVTDADGFEPFPLHLQGFTLKIFVLQKHFGRPTDPGIKAGKRQAAFIFMLLPFGADNTGIDDHVIPRLIVNIHDEEALKYANLRRRKTNPMIVAHRFQHVCCKLLQTLIKASDLARFFAQSGISFN